MNWLSHLITLFLSYVTITSLVETKILRVGREFNGFFSLIDANSRIPYNCVRNTTARDLRACVAKCLLDERCLTFNHHEELKICELLNISKFAEVGLLKRDKGWHHYETDDDNPNVGPVCEATRPCPHYQVCEDTYKSNPHYKCMCKEGFSGPKCAIYNGPGSAKDKPAPSCSLLMMKHKNLEEKIYFIKKNGKATVVERNCTRKERNMPVVPPTRYVDKPTDTTQPTTTARTPTTTTEKPTKTTEKPTTTTEKPTTTTESPTTTSTTTKAAASAPCLDESTFSDVRVEKCKDKNNINCDDPERYWSYQKCGRFCGYCGQGVCKNALLDAVCVEKRKKNPRYCDNDAAGTFTCRKMCNTCLATDTTVETNPKGI